MDTFARFAFFKIAWDACFAAIAAAILMIAYYFDPPVALFGGASVALFFAIVMLVKASFLTEDQVINSEPWQVMEAEQRPAGDDGRRLARDWMQVAFLRFAKGAAGIASVMFGFALLASWA